jgi:nucleoside-diphosphate-sugar epimerase
MKKILITGALGQIGTELTASLRKKYGNDNVIISDIRDEVPESLSGGIYEQLNILDKVGMEEILKKYEIDSVFHMAALLSATGEKNPQLCWDVNMNGTINLLDLGVKLGLEKIFVPSSIAVWGDGIPLDGTPQESVLRPTTMYGVTKVAGEAICNYYQQKFGLDIRGLRYPGIISSETLPGGGTTDYAVEIFYDAIQKGKYSCFLKEDATLPMMYMSDCVRGTIELMEADLNDLNYHADYNIAAVSFSPKELAEEIKRHIPEFEIIYAPDYRQKIAASWPRSINDDAARTDWGWEHAFGLEKMTEDMIEKLSLRLTAKV